MESRNNLWGILRHPVDFLISPPCIFDVKNYIIGREIIVHKN